MIEQHERLYHLDKPIVTQDDVGAEGVPRPILPPGWIGLEECNVSPVPSQALVVPHVLMHADIGVALIDVAPAESIGAEPAFRARLEAARFAAIFPGHLPVVHLQVEPPELRRLGSLLPPAFASLPPLSVPGGDGWVSVVRRALIRRDPSRAAPYSVRPDALPERAARPTMLNRDIGAQRVGASAPPSVDTPIPEVPTGRPPWVWAGVALAVLVVSAGGAVLLRGTAPAEAPTATAPIATAPMPQATASAGAAPAIPAAERPVPLSPPAAVPVPASRIATAAPGAAARTTPPPVQPQQAPSPQSQSQPAQSAQATTPPATTPPAAADRGLRVVVKSAANLRTQPDTKASILRTVPAGEVLHEYDRALGGWVQVGDGKPLGWIHSKLLGPAKP